MKYIVTVGYNEFEFTDNVTAMTYAELSKNYYVPSSYHTSKEIEVTISVEKEGKDA